METASTYADVYTDFQGLASLRAKSGANDPETLRKVAGQFEALFIQMMLKSMRDANLGEGLMDSDSVKTYQSMFDQQIGLDLSKRSGLGLAEMMVRQLSRGGAVADTDKPAGKDVPAAAAPVTALHPLPAVRPDAVPTIERPSAPQATAAGGTNTHWAPASPEDFVKTLLPHARRAARALGTRPEVLIAQAALETGWGKHMIRGGDGANSFNLFGIKADVRWQGERVGTDTVEFRDGVMRKERASFRAYASPAESFADYVAFLKDNPRYRDALNQAGDASAFARALSEAGYATDPDYHGKVQQIMDSPRLRDAISGAAQSPAVPLG